MEPQLIADVMPHGVNQKINARSPRDLGDGDEIGIAGDENNLVDDTAVSQGCDI